MHQNEATTESDANAPTLESKISLTKSLFTFTFFSTLIFATSWYWLNKQLENILVNRVSEVGQQITHIAANAASEAIVSEDKLFLQDLVNDVAKSHDVQSASIYRLNGTLLAQSDPLLSQTELVIEPDSLKQLLTSYLPQFTSQLVPFMVEVHWQNSHIGWFQIILDRHQLEKEIRTHSFDVTINIIIVFFIMTFIGFFFVFRRHKLQRSLLEHHIKTLSNNDSPEEVHQLHDAVSLIKSGKSSQANLHFSAPKIKELVSHECTTIDRYGLVLVMFLYCENENLSSDEELLDQQVKWYNAIFELAALQDFPCFNIGRGQFFIYSDNTRIEDFLHFTFLLKELNLRLQKIQNSFFIKVVMTEGHFILKQLTEGQSIVAGAAVNDAVQLMRTLKEFALISNELSEKIPLVEDDMTNWHSGISIDKLPNQLPCFSKENKTMIDRQVDVIFHKYWDEEINTHKGTS